MYTGVTHNIIIIIIWAAPQSRFIWTLIETAAEAFYFEVLLILYIIIIYDLVVSRVCAMQCAAVCILYAEIIAGWRYYNKTDYYYY